MNFKKIKIGFLVLFLFICSIPTSFAESKDISISDFPLRFSTSTFLQGNTFRIYATTKNNSNLDLLGVVKFYANGSQIGGDQAVSIFAQKTDDIFMDYTPTSYGNYKIETKFFPWETSGDDPSNNYISYEINIYPDADRDGIKNSDDPDDDNDGVLDTEDAFPLNPNEQYDTDGDNIGDNADTDDDNDGVPDIYDDVPKDPNETTDSDKDGIGDIKDTDDDNDGILDLQEEKIGTDPHNADTDKDTVNDKLDAFSLDPTETLDTDQDKIGNNKDTDDDNDGLLDTIDPFPLNKAPVIKIENQHYLLNKFSQYIFDASKSYDKDGQITSFLWKIDGNPKEGNSIDLTFYQNGNHEIELAIKDNNGETKTQKFQVSVMNLSLYIQISLILILILLAILIYLKYIADAKNSKKVKKANK
ncbi:MAG: PKD domain-containing protein [Candidatus Gracilibacteria bacterium]|jgi:hypothetical protein